VGRQRLFEATEAMAEKLFEAITRGRLPDSAIERRWAG
jgi:hypothetical protein